jgi:hypothetical protein
MTARTEIAENRYPSALYIFVDLVQASARSTVDELSSSLPFRCQPHHAFIEVNLEAIYNILILYNKKLQGLHIPKSIRTIGTGKLYRVNSHLGRNERPRTIYQSTIRNTTGTSYTEERPDNRYGEARQSKQSPGKKRRTEDDIPTTIRNTTGTSYTEERPNNRYGEAGQNKQSTCNKKKRRTERKDIDEKK